MNIDYLAMCVDEAYYSLFYEALGYLTSQGHKVNLEALLKEYIPSEKHWEITCTHDMETGALYSSIVWNPVPPEVFFKDPQELYRVTVGVVE